MIKKDTKLSELAPFLKEDAEFFAEQLSHYIGEYIDPTYMLISFDGPESVKKGIPYAEVGILFLLEDDSLKRGYLRFVSDMKDKDKFLKLKGDRNIEIIEYMNQVSKSLVTDERRYFISCTHGKYIFIRTELKHRNRMDKYKLACVMYTPYVDEHLKLINEDKLKLAAFCYPKNYISFYTNPNKALYDYEDYIAQIICDKRYRRYSEENDAVELKGYNLSETLIQEFTANNNYKSLDYKDVYYSKYDKYYVPLLIIPADRQPKTYAADIRYAMKVLHQDVNTFSLNSIFCVFGIEDENSYLQSLPTEELILLYSITKDKRIRYYSFMGTGLKDLIWTEDELKAINVSFRDMSMNRVHCFSHCVCGRRRVQFRYYDVENDKYVPVCSPYCIEVYKSRISQSDTEIDEAFNAADVEEF